VEDNYYCDVSAKAWNNVSMAFEELTKRIIKKQKEESKKPDKVLRGKEERKSIGLKPADNDLKPKRNVVNFIEYI
jgi:hypothetical protein